MALEKVFQKDELSSDFLILRFLFEAHEKGFVQNESLSESIANPKTHQKLTEQRIGFGSGLARNQPAFGFRHGFEDVADCS